MHEILEQKVDVSSDLQLVSGEVIELGEVEETEDDNVYKEFGMERIEGLVKTGWVLEAAKDLTMDTGADFAAQGLE